jgi:hypothetical protein
VQKIKWKEQNGDDNNKDSEPSTISIPTNYKQYNSEEKGFSQ